MTILDTTELFHLDDPVVSEAATPDVLATEAVMHAVVTLIDERGSLAPFELERAYADERGRRGWPKVAYYSVHKRASQLKKHVNVLRGTGDHVVSPTGRRGERLGLIGPADAAHDEIRRYAAGGVGR